MLTTLELLITVTVSSSAMPSACPFEMKSDVPTSDWRCVDEYTQSHFGTEESLMDEHHFPDAARHRQSHQELIAQLFALVCDFERGKTAITMDTMTFLRDWLTRHIGVMDKQLAAFLDKK